MSKILIVGDPHLGKGLNLGKVKPKQLNSKILDQFKLLDWILDLAIEKSVDRIIITGDVFEDVKPAHTLLKGFLDFLNFAEKHRIYVDIILGNHDLQRTGQELSSSLDILDYFEYQYINFYKYLTTLELDNIYLTFMPFRDRRFYNLFSISEALDQIHSELSLETAKFEKNYSNVLIGHLALSGSIPVGDEFDDSLNELICPLNFFSEYNYVWMGHVHKPQVLKDDFQHIAHIGSLDLSNIDEIGQKKILIFFNSKDNIVEEIEVPLRPLFKLKLEFDKIGDITSEIKSKILSFSEVNNLANSIFKLEINFLSDAFFDKNEIQILLDSLSVFHLAQFSENKIITSAIETKISSPEDLLDPTQAIKIWANLFQFPENISCSEFLNEAQVIIESFEENND